MRRPLTAFAVIVTAVGATATPAAAQAPVPAEAEVVIEGKGYGHGVGLPQDGALAMGAAGASAADILQHFYPGTAIGRRSGAVRVNLFDAPRASATLSFPTGGVVEPASGDHPGFPVSASPGGRVRVSYDGGRFTATPLDGATAAPMPPPEAASPTAARAGEAPAPATATTTTVPSLLGLIPLPPPPTTAPPTPTTTALTAAAEPTPRSSQPVASSPLVATPANGGTLGVTDLDRIYRGTITATPAGGAALQLVNELDVEQYIRGMGEVIDSGWPAASLQVQAIVARTYALDAMAAGRALCSSQQCQVYLGSTAEYAAMNRAVADTAGQVLTYQGRLAEAVYSASAGGVTATPEEGFGMQGGNYPYLTPVAYSTADPQAWELRLTLGELARRLGYPGQPSGVAVSRTGPSGRALEITVTGDAGPHAADARKFATDFGLRSNFFTIRTAGPAGDAQGAAATTAPGATRFLRHPALVLEAGPAASQARAAWAAVAVLLIAWWATAATQFRSRTRLGDNAAEV